MNNEEIERPRELMAVPDDERPTGSIEWYAEGQTRVVDVDGTRVTIRYVGRRGRRARIAITAPPGTVFYAPAAERQFSD